MDVFLGFPFKLSEASVASYFSVVGGIMAPRISQYLGMADLHKKMFDMDENRVIP
jgi:hypothetical protein